MTGVSHNVTAFYPGVQCIMHQLRKVRSQVPLVIAVPAEEEALAKTLLAADEAGDSSAGSIDVSIRVWNRFPYDYGRSSRVAGGASLFQRRWRSSHVFDKLNVLGAPWTKLVWLDADVLIKRNVDELCTDDSRESTAGPSLHAAVDSGFEPRTCFQQRHGVQCHGCQHHGLHADEVCKSCGYWTYQAMTQQAAGNRSHLPECTYEFNTGVLVVRPLGAAAFDELVVRPVRCGVVATRDGSDQGLFNSLVHSRKIFGPRGFGTLPSQYNMLHRVYNVRPPAWQRVDPAVVHLVGERKPWGAKAREGAFLHYGSVYLETERQWLTACGDAEVTRFLEVKAEEAAVEKERRAALAHARAGRGAKPAGG